MTSAVDVLVDLQALYAAIVARMTGQQVQSGSHKDRSASYAATPLEQMVRMYQSLWVANKAAAQQAGLPYLQDPSIVQAQRGRLTFRL